MTFPAPALDVQELTDNVASVAQATGLFDKVNRYEPTQAPGNGLTAAVFLSGIGPLQFSGLDSTTIRYVFTCRIYTNIFFSLGDAPNPNMDAIDPVLGNAVSTLIQAYTQDFTLDGSVMFMDLLGKFGVSLGGKAGYLQQDKKVFRIFDITVPLIVPDVWEQSP